MEDKETLRQISFRIPLDLYKAFAILCIEKDTSQQETLRELVRQYVKRKR